MANFDVKNDVAPKNQFKPPSSPTIAALRTALTTFSATSYTADRLNAMTENDMIYAARLHGLMESEDYIEVF